MVGCYLPIGSAKFVVLELWSPQQIIDHDSLERQICQRKRATNAIGNGERGNEVI